MGCHTVSATDSVDAADVGGTADIPAAHAATDADVDIQAAADWSRERDQG